jgi:phosphoglycolate phosphatase-like HAD superfamily hydrolase
MEAIPLGTLTAILVDLDDALGDTRPLWNDWLAGATAVLPIDPATLSADRGAAAAELDAAGAGNWRILLERFAADRAPVYLRPNAEASSVLRGLASTGRPIGVFTDAPEGLARIAVSQLGVARRIAALETGRNALERLTAAFGTDAIIVRTLAELVASSADQEPSR